MFQARYLDASPTPASSSNLGECRRGDLGLFIPRSFSKGTFGRHAVANNFTKTGYAHTHSTTKNGGLQFLPCRLLSIKENATFQWTDPPIARPVIFSLWLAAEEGRASSLSLPTRDRVGFIAKL